MPKFIVEGTTYDLVQARFTFGEAKAIEKVTGLSIQTILNDEDAQGRADVLQAFFWISMKRTEPTITFADLEDVDMAGIEVLEDEPTPEQPDPTQPAVAGVTESVDESLASSATDLSLYA